MSTEEITQEDSPTLGAGLDRPHLLANDLRKDSEGFLSLPLMDMGCWCLQFCLSHPSLHNDPDNQLTSEASEAFRGTGKTPVMIPAGE